MVVDKEEGFRQRQGGGKVSVGGGVLAGSHPARTGWSCSCCALEKPQPAQLSRIWMAVGPKDTLTKSGGGRGRWCGAFPVFRQIQRVRLSCRCRPPQPVHSIFDVNLPTESQGLLFTSGTPSTFSFDPTPRFTTPFSHLLCFVRLSTVPCPTCCVPLRCSYMCVTPILRFFVGTDQRTEREPAG